MKKIIIIIGFISLSSFSLQKNDLISQNCEEYAHEAALAENEQYNTGWLTDWFLYQNAYQWYLGFCETQNLNGGEALQPVFID